MRNLKSIPKLQRYVALALLALVSVTSTSYAAPEVGATVKDCEGRVIGTIAAPLPTQPKLAPTVIIALTTGGKQVTAVQLLQPLDDGLMVKAPGAQDNSDQTAETVFEIRSMTRALIMQSHEDVKLLGDITNLDYEIQGDTLIMRGSLESLDNLERLIETTAELSDLQIAPQIILRDHLNG